MFVPFSHLAQRSPYTEGVPGWGVQKFGHKDLAFSSPMGSLKLLTNDYLLKTSKSVSTSGSFA